jgi:steroid 5-alpha reductase family enzyme
MTSLVLSILVVMLVVMSAAWAFQRATGNGGWVDVFWTYGTGACCAAAALVPTAPGIGITWRQALVAGLATLWSLRLGTYVAMRVASGPEDARYAAIRTDWGADFQRKMFGLLIIQAPVTTVLGIAILFAARAPDPDFRTADALGVLILVIGIAGEALADHQLRRFKSDPTNHGRICDRGLWGWSRHPNYFFEALLWLAYSVIGVSLARPWSLLACLAPVVMFVVLRFATGVPPLEAAMLRSKGDAFRRYQQRVSPLLPWPPRRF